MDEVIDEVKSLYRRFCKFFCAFYFGEYDRPGDEERRECREAFGELCDWFTDYEGLYSVGQLTTVPVTIELVETAYMLPQNGWARWDHLEWGKEDRIWVSPLVWGMATLKDQELQVVLYHEMHLWSERVQALARYYTREGDRDANS